MRNFVTGNIPDFPEYYITKNGKLYSKWSGVWKLKSLSRIKNNGYVIQTLHNKAGLKKTFGIHQLVALVYIPNPDNKTCVCHKDNIRTHNHYINLYWGTNKENSNQMVVDGRHYIPPNKLTNNDIRNLYNDRISGMYIKDLVIKYGISRMTTYKYLKQYEKDFKRSIKV